MGRRRVKRHVDVAVASISQSGVFSHAWGCRVGWRQSWNSEKPSWALNVCVLEEMRWSTRDCRWKGVLRDAPVVGLYKGLISKSLKTFVLLHLPEALGRKTQAANLRWSVLPCRYAKVAPSILFVTVRWSFASKWVFLHRWFWSGTAFWFLETCSSSL